ncbi:MAG: 3-deoxy-manno-octulosonate cytidylyltransferase [Nitrospinota bacterium]|nr:3-deoxy-manno-octulosonate cytidylyltransferase [Nitrospinota bacterium]
MTNERNNVLCVIPARWGSSRFPGKPLAEMAGHPMIEHVYRRAQAAAGISKTLVATDDDRIAEAVAAFGGEVRMTRPDHPSGTDRVAEVAGGEDGDGYEVVVNVQGDEPLIHPEDIAAAVAPLLQDPGLEMSTLAVPLGGAEDFLDPNVVKVVVGEAGNALYFSRVALPYMRDQLKGAMPPASALESAWVSLPCRPLKHLGLYAYRRDWLLRLAGLPPSPLEESERLEQLRALEEGAWISVVEVAHDSLGVDVPNDLTRLMSDSALRAALEEEVRKWPSTSS